MSLITALNTGLSKAMFVKKIMTGSQVTVQANAQNVISNIAPTDRSSDMC